MPIDPQRAIEAYVRAQTQPLQRRTATPEPARPRLPQPSAPDTAAVREAAPSAVPQAATAARRRSRRRAGTRMRAHGPGLLVRLLSLLRHLTTARRREPTV
ncbi:hypothetical protein ACFQVC_06265 [Streptomyces monticola]|uniref:Uncharacterized protein n=1 Tax=Streptomyces monticola TaxID=2666263 RepID=A0ABW2JDZ7_9ACTN